MNEIEKQTRKEYARKGERTQKMMTFRVDADVQEILTNVANKGRLLNDLVKEWWRSRNREEHDHHPDEEQIPASDE